MMKAAVMAVLQCFKGNRRFSWRMLIHLPVPDFIVHEERKNKNKLRKAHLRRLMFFKVRRQTAHHIWWQRTKAKKGAEMAVVPVPLAELSHKGKC